MSLVCQRSANLWYGPFIIGWRARVCMEKSTWHQHVQQAQNRRRSWSWHRFHIFEITSFWTPAAKEQERLMWFARAFHSQPRNTCTCMNSSSCHKKFLCTQQQSSSSSSNRFIEHDVSTRTRAFFGYNYVLLIVYTLLFWCFLVFGITVHLDRLAMKVSQVSKSSPFENLFSFFRCPFLCFSLLVWF